MRRAFGPLGGVSARTLALLFAGSTALAVCVASAIDSPLAVNAKPVPLADNLAIGERVGKFRFLGMLAIPSVTINGQRLSQLSDIAWDQDAATLYAISDKGALFHLHPVFRDDALVDVKVSRAMPLRDLKTREPLRYKRADAEGLTLLRQNNGRPNDTELAVSFERFPRVVRYRTDGYAIAEIPLPPALSNPAAYSDDNRMLEGLCYDTRYGLLTVPETPLKNETPGYNRLYSLAGRSWRYPIQSQNRIVSLACRGNGEVLVLESDFGIRFWRSHITLKRVRLSETTNADTPLQVETLFTLDSGEGYQIDNFEGIAHHRGARYFLLSDNNDFFLQRTLLLYFELLEE